MTWATRIHILITLAEPKTYKVFRRKIVQLAVTREQPRVLLADWIPDLSTSCDPTHISGPRNPFGTLTRTLDITFQNKEFEHTHEACMQ